VAGVAGSSSGSSASAGGLTPDQLAAYCTHLEEPDGSVTWLTMDYLHAAEKGTPVQLKPNMDVLVADSQAIKDGTRIWVQLKDEMAANYKPLKDFHDQACVVH